MIKIINRIRKLNYNTIYFNFKYLPFRLAIKIPFLISSKVWLKKMAGKITIESSIKTGMISIGYDDVGIFDKKYSRTIWEVQGEIIFKGNANIGHGSKISVLQNGILVFGNNFQLTAESTIICGKLIVFGENNLISWDNLFLDTDFHNILDAEGKIINAPKEIIIGNNVWIGCRCLILKGSTIPDWNVVAANSMISSTLDGENKLVGGNPIRELRQNIKWSHSIE